MLPYSPKEIYKLVNHYSNVTMKRYYSFEELYSNFPKILANFDTVIMEDSNAGYTFFGDFFSNTFVTSARGNSSVFNTLINTNTRNILCIVDGAAFGAFVEKIIKYCESNLDKRVTLWLPESFEWILLKAGVFTYKDLDKILENPSEYIECKDYASWERFFTALAQKASNPQWPYNKNNLNDYYLTEGIKKKVNVILPKELQEFAKKQVKDITKKMSLF